VIDPHDMTCQELVEVLTEYLDGMLGMHDRARLEAHLSVCDDCRAYVAQFEATITVTRRADGGALAPSLREELRRVFRGHAPRADENGL
jgi:anti-sigma factor RsiW